MSKTRKPIVNCEISSVGHTVTAILQRQMGTPTEKRLFAVKTAAILNQLNAFDEYKISVAGNQVKMAATYSNKDHTESSQTEILEKIRDALPNFGINSVQKSSQSYIEI